MSAIKKTNAARLLDELHIPYTLHGFMVDEDDLSAVAAAAALGAEPGQVFKTLIARGDKGGVLAACIPADAVLNFKALAVLSGNKSVQLVPLKEVQPLTGYIRGGCSPLGMRKAYPVYIDTSVILYDRVYVSAGARGVQLCVHPDALVRATGARCGDIVVDSLAE